MTVYKYYAVIHQDEDAFIVDFPDIENCFTDGETLAHAVEMAHDALGLLLSVEEDDNTPIPKASSAKDIDFPEGASLVLIEVNTDDFRESLG